MFPQTSSFSYETGEGFVETFMRFSSINLEGERKSSGRFTSFIVLLLEIMLGGPNYFTELRNDHLPREQFSCVCIFTNQSSVALSWKIPTYHASKPFSTWISKVLKSPLENSVSQIRGTFPFLPCPPNNFMWCHSQSEASCQGK